MTSFHSAIRTSMQLAWWRGQGQGLACGCSSFVCGQSHRSGRVYSLRSSHGVTKIPRGVLSGPAFLLSDTPPPDPFLFLYHQSPRNSVVLGNKVFPTTGTVTHRSSRSTLCQAAQGTVPWQMQSAFTCRCR